MKSAQRIKRKRLHQVFLTNEEKRRLAAIVSKGSARARVITRARILLMADLGLVDREIYEALNLAESTPYDIRKKYALGGVDQAIYDLPRPGQKRKLTGNQEAEVVAIACSQAPKGYVRWTVDLLTEEVKTKLKVDIGRTAIWKVLLRNNLKPWRKKNVVYSQGHTRVCE